MILGMILILPAVAITTPPTQYYLFVKNTKTGGSPAADFYFIDHYLPAPLYNHAELEKADHTGTSNDTAAALVLETELQAGLIGKPNQVSAVVAGMSGERPVFVDPA